MSRSDAEHIANSREHLRRLDDHLQRGNLADDTIFDAVCMRLGAAIESISAVDPALRDSVLGPRWPAMWSVRNRLAHGYVYIDRAIITATVRNDLTEFAQALDDLDAAVAHEPSQEG